MRVQTEEWRRFIPGVRMYKGKKTLFYNGEILREGGYWDGRFVIYDEEERQSWQVIIVLPGVEVIPSRTFSYCMNVETVIMNDSSVRSIENDAFAGCTSLTFVKFSRNLEFIGERAFSYCSSLPSIFIPPACTEIGEAAFEYCNKLIIFSVPRHTQLGRCVIDGTALIPKFYVMRIRDNGVNLNRNHDETIFESLYNWNRNINEPEKYALHRACSSFQPLEEIIHDIVKRQGLRSLKKKNDIGVTPLQYLEANPYADIKEKKIMKRYILDMIGELVM